MSDDLEPMAPDAALDMYLETRRGEASDSTLQSHEYRIGKFVEWCEEEEITNLNDLSGRDLHAFRVWRREQGDLKMVTLRGQLSTLRSFLRFCSSVNAVPEGLRSKVMLPTVSSDEQVSETSLDAARAEDILAYLDRYQYASRRHVITLVLWHTGMRVGALRALDLDDCQLDSRSPGVELVHRPEQDTPLKNKESGERWVALSERIARILQDYIDGPREDVTDDYGRDPLVTTSHGRPSTSSLRDAIYCVTRPCAVGKECPHDRDPEDCDATHIHKASTCPSSRSPHDVRSGAITAHLLEDVPHEIVSDRMDVSRKVLDKHYDRRTKREKMEQRREYLPDN